MIGGKDLLEDVAEGDLAPRAARLDVAENALQIADTGRQSLHLADALMHSGQRIIDHLERCAEPLFKGRLELFVDRLPHLLQLLGVL